jgi:hypothetical protein
MNENDDVIPFKKGQLSFTSKNEALSFQRDYQKRGYIKKCFHAKIQEYRHIDPWFEPECSQSSYLFIEEEKYFIGCPKSCAYYQPIPYGKIKDTIRKVAYKIRLIFLNIGKTVKWVLEWYASLTPSVQIILSLCLLVLIFSRSPTIYNSIVELLKTLLH